MHIQYIILGIDSPYLKGETDGKILHYSRGWKKKNPKSKLCVPPFVFIYLESMCCVITVSHLARHLLPFHNSGWSLSADEGQTTFVTHLGLPNQLQTQHRLTCEQREVKRPTSHFPSLQKIGKS